MRHDKLVPHHKTDDGSRCAVCDEPWPCTHMQEAGAKRSGTRNGRAKLTPEEVAGIRHMHATGALSISAIARIFGLNPTTVLDAISGENWKQL